jgi:hypothetical protein
MIAGLVDRNLHGMREPRAAGRGPGLGIAVPATNACKDNYANS